MNITKYVDNRHSIKIPAAVVFLRKNFIVADANERYYSFVGKQSGAEFNKLIYEEDAQEFVDTVSGLKENVTEHFVVRMSNLEDDYRMVYIIAKLSKKMEDGERLYEIMLHDIVDMTEHYTKVEFNLRKYIRFLMMSGLYFFEYNINSGIFKIYKYLNDRSVMLVEEPLDSWCEGIMSDSDATENIINDIIIFKNNLKKGILSFDMVMDEIRDKGKTCRIKGLPLRFYNEQQLAVGIINSNNIDSRQTYYMSPAAKDSGTGVLNKKAVVEYIIDRLKKQDGKIRWLIVFDIDNFKEVNDKFGHLFGDRVIQLVADTISDVFKRHGTVGRYGGDEFLAFIEDIDSEEDIRIRLKTISKHLQLAFSQEPEHNIKITLSMGVTRYPVDGTVYNELFEKADKALYIAKDKGRNRYIIYSEDKHGDYKINSIQMNGVEYAVSCEKRTSALSGIAVSLATEGIKNLVTCGIQELLIRIFDLDGMTIYTDCGKKRFSVTGNYNEEIDDIISKYMDTGYHKTYNGNGICVAGSMNSIKARNAQAYQIARRTEIGAYIHCITYDGDKPEIIVSFDIFNRSRKWSDADAEELSVIGKLIGNVLLKENR